MKKEHLLTFIILLMVVTTTNYILNQGEINGDAKYHLEKILGHCEPQNSICEKYPPLYHRLASFFVFDRTSLQWFNIILFLIIYPLAFYWFCDKKPYSIFFYLVGTSFYSYILLGPFPSGLATLFYLVFLKTKEPLTKTGFFILGIGTHNYSFFLFGITWIIQILNEKKETFNQWFVPIGIGPEYFIQRATENIYGKLNLWFTTNFPGITIIGIYHWIKEKNIVYLTVITLSFIASLDIARSLYVFQLLTLAGFVHEFQNFTTNQKKVFIILGILFYLYTFTFLLDVVN